MPQAPTPADQSGATEQVQVSSATLNYSDIISEERSVAHAPPIPQVKYE